MAYNNFPIGYLKTQSPLQWRQSALTSSLGDSFLGARGGAKIMFQVTSWHNFETSPFLSERRSEAPLLLEKMDVITSVSDLNSS